MSKRRKELEAIVGSLSNPSKMPGRAYGIPAEECPLGAILRKKDNSVCSICYAHKGMYVFPVVKNAQRKRLESIARSDWTEKMTELIRLSKTEYFRWHDSGDLQNAEHLSKIVAIANNLPGVKFWLPTKERDLVTKFFRNRSVPNNLTIRVSAPMLRQEAPKRLPGRFVASTVDSSTGYACPARTQKNECGDCRACWDKNVKSVDYPSH